MRERQARRQNQRAAAKLDSDSSSIAPRTVMGVFSGTAVWLAAALCAINLAIYAGVAQHGFVDLDDGA
jgi:hypothetical protein